ncbi:hypothetical protein ILUMI_06523 [Ignelater luminosus]|uniref:Endoplasmic reticulum resident protein 29 n=1 Tax=Ignelater luminosus TaxID=2038154 RepID=A0A8K0D593_IGNLU|nr:hypothetical protein ILUMI_06523 [Ignelater luminosus]
MRRVAFLSAFVTLISIISTTLACKGCVSLDEYNFEKVISRFKAVLVKFDVAYPYGDKHETYTKLAEEIAQNKEILIAEVGIKDYGDKENEELGKKYGVKSKDDLPAVRLFLQGRNDPIQLPKSSEWTVDNLRNLVRDNTDIYIGLPGCLEKYDKLAMEFVRASMKDKDKKVKDTEKLLSKETESDKPTAKTYVLFMKKILEQGVQFIKQEITRLGKIVKDGKVNDKKKEELSHRINILHSFSVPLKDEL